MFYKLIDNNYEILNSMSIGIHCANNIYIYIISCSDFSCLSFCHNNLNYSFMHDITMQII